MFTEFDYTVNRLTFAPNLCEVRTTAAEDALAASVAMRDNPDSRAPPRRGRRCPRADSGRPSTGRSGCRRPPGPAGCRRGTSAARAPPAGGSPAPSVGLACLGDGARRPVGRNEQHGGLPGREHGGVSDRIGHSRTSVRLDICGKMSLLTEILGSFRSSRRPRPVSDLPVSGYWNGSLTGRPKWPSFGCLR
jgi:hypothetical protein